MRTRMLMGGAAAHLESIVDPRGDPVQHLCVFPCHRHSEIHGSSRMTFTKCLKCLN